MQRDWQLLHPYKSAVPPISKTTTPFLSTHFHALSNRHLIFKGDFLIHLWEPVHCPPCNPIPKLPYKAGRTKEKKPSYNEASGKPRSLLSMHTNHLLHPLVPAHTSPAHRDLFVQHLGTSGPWLILSVPRHKCNTDHKEIIIKSLGS